MKIQRNSRTSAISRHLTATLRTCLLAILFCAGLLLVTSFFSGPPSHANFPAKQPIFINPGLGAKEKLPTTADVQAKSTPAGSSSSSSFSTQDIYGPVSSTVNPHPFKFLLLEEDICSRKRRDLFILSVVHTAPRNYKQRMLIRETWGSQKLYRETKTVVIFAMGATNDSKIQKSLTLESKRYQDIIQENFFDSYKNLTYKGIMWLKWVSTYCPHVPYVLKVDDDIFVNIFNLVTHLKNLHSRSIINQRTILCLVWSTMHVLRDPKNKWFVSKDEYQNNQFSTYCSGSAYVLSNQLIRPMYEQSFRIKFFWVDDFYITGLLPKHLNVEYKNIGSLYVLKHQELHDRLVGSYAIFGHIPGALSKRYKFWKEVLKMQGIQPW